ncbi:hypothetical protein BDW62DRAFT_194095 [Aspergillus aurantiobrunneus]
MVDWLKSDAVAADVLPDDVRAFLQRPTIRTTKSIHMLVPALTSDSSYVWLVAFLMNEQSRGEVRLQSSDPEVPLPFDANLLAHPYDQRVCIEAMREVLAVSKTEAFSKDTVSTILGPQSELDEDILKFWRSVAGSAWHMTGTVKMGMEGQLARLWIIGSGSLA